MSMGATEKSLHSYLSIDGNPGSVVLCWLERSSLLLVPKLKPKHRKNVRGGGGGIHSVSISKKS